MRNLTKKTNIKILIYSKNMSKNLINNKKNIKNKLKRKI